MRSIRVVAGGTSRDLDLYALLEGRIASLPDLADGASIIVPAIGRTVGVVGDVVRPGIYELHANRPAVNTKDALKLGGGTLRPRGFALTRMHFDDGGRQVFTTLDGDDTKITESDILAVMRKSDASVGDVTLTGHVRVPGVRALNSAPTLSSLIGTADLLALDPYLGFAVVETTDPRSQVRLLKAVDLGAVLSGDTDYSLRDHDRVVILGRKDIDFLGRNEVRNVILTGRADARNCAALGSLARIVEDSKSNRFAAALRNVYFTGTEAPEAAEEAENPAGGEAGSIVGQQELQDVSVREADCPRIYQESPQLLSFVLEHVVAVSGAVRSPGILPIAAETDLGVLIASSGGLSTDADEENVELLYYQRSQGAGQSIDRRYISLRTNDPENVAVSPGSSVRIFHHVSEQEPGAVLLSGEFKRPGTYSIAKGETLSELIERSGGLTDHAYPYGAVFTRTRVKEEQQASFRRTAREINTGLALALLKNKVEGDAVAAAQQLSSSFASIEAQGRVVVEADPMILARERRLDTILEAGDAIAIPKQPNYVVMAGDLLNPGALRYTIGKTARQYLDESGGILATADKKRIFVVYPNGVAQPVRRSLWSRQNVQIYAGTTIVVPKNMDPLRTLDIVRDVSSIVGQLAISAASLAVVFDRR